MDLDLRLVRYAVTLADELHFGRAASKLVIAQQTLSSQIAHLENVVGVPLFVRDRRHVELTAAGEVFVARGRGLLTQAQELLAEVNRTAPPVRVDVITEGLTPGVLANLVRARLPGQPIEVLQGQGLAMTVTALVQGKVDVAFGRVHGLGRALPKELRHRVVRWEPMGVVVPADHDLACRDRIRMADLRGCPMVSHVAEEAAEWGDWNDAVATAFGLRIAHRLHGHGRGSANAAVVRYGAPAFAPLEAPVPDDVVVRPVVDPIPVYPFSVVWRPSRGTDGLVRAMGEIAAELGWLRPPTDAWWVPDDDRPAPTD